MKQFDSGLIVLARIKPTSKFAKKEKDSDKFREFYKVEVNGDFLSLINDEKPSSGEAIEEIKSCDVAYIYCIENGKTKPVLPEIFFETYRKYLESDFLNLTN